MEVLKIKYSRLLSVGRTVKVLVTTFHDYDIGLLSRLASHLVNLKNIEVVGLEKLCDDLDICYDPLTPLDTINRVISSLSDRHSDTLTLLLLDEVPPSEVGQRNPDWRQCEVRENVIWLLGLSPRAPLASSTQILPPLSNSVLSWHLIHKYRNCPQIRNLSRSQIILTTSKLNIFICDWMFDK